MSSMSLAASSGSDSAAPDAPAVSRYLQVIRDQIRVVILAVVIAVLAAAAYVATATKTYVAQAEMLVSPATSSDATLFSLPVLHASGDPTADVLTAANLVTTPEVADAVIRRLHLNTTRAALLGQVQATPVGQANLVSIQATEPTASDAA